MVLERRCEDCDGTGLFRLDDSNPESKCELCDGTGFAPTPLGREVIELVKHNLRNILGERLPENDALDRPVESLGSGIRFRECMQHFGITTVRELMAYSGDDLLKRKGFGISTLWILLERLAETGLTLRGEALKR